MRWTSGWLVDVLMCPRLLIHASIPHSELHSDIERHNADERADESIFHVRHGGAAMCSRSIKVFIMHARTSASDARIHDV